jgi:hypothetical protein
MDAAVEPKTQLEDVEYWKQLYEMQPASVTVTRRSEEDFKQRQLVISLDRERLGDLLFGASISRDVAPGPHMLRVSNTLVWKTVAFDVKPGEQVRFEAINRPGRLTYPMLVILGAGPLYVTVKRVA